MVTVMMEYKMINRSTFSQAPRPKVANMGASAHGDSVDGNENRNNIATRKTKGKRPIIYYVEEQDTNTEDQSTASRARKEISFSCRPGSSLLELAPLEPWLRLSEGDSQKAQKVWVEERGPLQQRPPGNDDGPGEIHQPFEALEVFEASEGAVDLTTTQQQ
ncbi:hypothetical protein QBC43DRAFT_293088 [Cladorrhinum sp. PSN259]|nr:hypothetical protein QBC43DRAFT_293088 [Cladorrhinum sp. PSN259]